MPNFKLHQKQSSLSELSDPQTFAAKTLQVFASFSEFWKDGLVPDRNLIDISYELGLTHYEIIQIIQFERGISSPTMVVLTPLILVLRQFHS